MNFDKFKVIDNFIPKFYQEELKSKLIGTSKGYGFPWFFTSDITYGEHAATGNKNPAFSHLFKHDDLYTSPQFSLVQPLADKGIKEANVTYRNIIQARGFIQIPIAEQYKRSDVDLLHIDAQDPHLVILYYVVDADGDTILTDYKYKIGDIDRQDMKVEDHNIIARVTPKQGRVLLFDGSYYHTAEQPKNSIRCVINMDVAA
jgi:hypothetical protein